MDLDKSMARMEEQVCLLIVVAAFDFANDLECNRSKWDHNPDSNMPKDYFVDHANRSNIGEVPGKALVAESWC